MKKILVLLVVFWLVTASSGLALANQLLFDRGLPTANLNNAAASDRSNVAWGFGYDIEARWLAGDDFKFSNPGTYLVDTIRIWSTSSNVSLWFGSSGGTFEQLSPSQSVSVTYSDGTTYQGSSGSFMSLYQYDFSINEVLSSSTTYQFFLDGPIPSFIHSSNAALSGSTQEGFDNLMLAAYIKNGTLTYDSSWDSHGNGWDKSSDANVQVFGTQVPEPTTILLLGLGLFGLARAGRKFKK